MTKLALSSLFRSIIAVMAIAMLLTTTMPGIVFGKPNSQTAQGEAVLVTAHSGATNPGYKSGACPAPGWGWHFVFAGNDTEFVAISAQFAQAGHTTAFISYPTAKHAYVYTPGPDTLISATATTNGGKETRFHLSHVCQGNQSEAGPTKTPQPVPTATMPPTVTPEPTPTATMMPDPTATMTPEATVPSLPTATAVPTATPESNVTFEPTATPAVTTTPEPGVTSEPTVMPEPSVTPEPTVTSEPTATPDRTATAEPTSTPQPVVTPEPTATAKPTATPQPVAMSEPTATPEPTTGVEEPRPGTLPNTGIQNAGGWMTLMFAVMLVIAGLGIRVSQFGRR